MESLGRHIIVELFDCEPAKTDDVAMVQKGMEEAALEAGATLINSTFHHFAPIGVSGVVVIQESHLSIHTWPEYGFASVDIFTCGESVDPWKAISVLQKTLGAKHHSAVEMLRGQKSQLTKNDFYAHEENYITTPNQINRQIWFTERSDNFALSIKHQGDLLYRSHSRFQRIEVYNTEDFGKMLVLDSVIVLTEKDGFVYHEMITHVPILTHLNPKKVLILGGGDGAVATEVLKHNSIDQVDVIEIDKEVKTVIDRFFPSLGIAFNDKRTTLYYEDITNIEISKRLNTYDVIIDDLHSALNTNLNDYGYLNTLKETLNDKGIIVTSVVSPHLNKTEFQSNVAALRGIFGAENVACYTANIPTFPTGLWCFALCSPLKSLHHKISPKSIKAFTNGKAFQYYTYDMHQAAFILPPYLERLLEEAQ